MTLSKFALIGFAITTTAGCTINNPPPAGPAPPTPAAAAPAAAPAPAPAAAAPAAAAPAPAAAAPAAAPAAAAPAAPAAAAAQPAFQDTPPPAAADAPQTIKFSVADGRPKGLHNKAPEAFWVWHDAKGKNWHVRSTTHTQRHRFHGSVIPDSGAVTEVHATKTEWGDRIRASSKGISFDFTTTGGEDGFDFQTNGQCVRFHLLIDGKSAPGLINVGKDDTHPPVWHFKLCP